MSLSERSRAVLYRRLTTIIEDEEAVGEMLSNFPATDADRPATKDFVHAEIHAATIRMITWMVTLDIAMVGLLLGFFRKG